MGLDALLARLEAQSVTSAAHGNAYNVTAKPKEIKDCTAVTYVTPKNNSTALNDPIFRMPMRGTDDWDDFEERAAIMEFDGGMSRADAEQSAQLDMDQSHAK